MLGKGCQLKNNTHKGTCEDSFQCAFKHVSSQPYSLPLGRWLLRSGWSLFPHLCDRTLFRAHPEPSPRSPQHSESVASPVVAMHLFRCVSDLFSRCRRFIAQIFAHCWAHRYCLGDSSGTPDECVASKTAWSLSLSWSEPWAPLTFFMVASYLMNEKNDAMLLHFNSTVPMRTENNVTVAVYLIRTEEEQCKRL